LRRLHDAEVDEVVSELRPHEEFGGEVDDGAVFPLEVGMRRVDPAMQHQVAHGVGEGNVIVVAGRHLLELGLHAKQLFFDGAADLVRRHARIAGCHVSPSFPPMARSGVAGSQVQIIFLAARSRLRKNDLDSHRRRS
jgi:hypothetical protein